MRTDSLLHRADIPCVQHHGPGVRLGGGTPGVNAYIEAISRADTTIVYFAATDTSGQFDAGPLPQGEYLVRALIDQNSNRNSTETRSGIGRRERRQRAAGRRARRDRARFDAAAVSEHHRRSTASQFVSLLISR